MRINLASEMNVLASRFHRLAMSERRTRDFTYNGMLGALEEVIAAFPVYRTYVSARGSSVDDRRYIDWAIAQAKGRLRAGGMTILDFIRGVLTADLPWHSRPRDVFRTAMQFQQVTGPVMAKACEDTAFYRYGRLLALNEVGGDPRRFGMSAGAFHRVTLDRARNWPRAIVTTATHDTKRGEDARLRIAMLSEMPREWGRRVTAWLRLNRRHRSELNGAAAPGRNLEYFFYQTLVGVWPVGLDALDADPIAELAKRVDGYMLKAVREGKEHSSWSYPDAEYEAALQRFVRGALDASRPNPFLADFAEFVGLLVRPAAIASLSQLVLKLTVPGVADVYQGGELWDFSLVDPDNRRPVDFARRQALLAELERATAGDLVRDWQDGREKLFVTRTLLALRREHSDLFAAGEYQPLEIGEGRNADRLCAFARIRGAKTMVVAVPRLTWGLYRDGGPADWGATEIALPHGETWRDVFTGRVLPVCERVCAADLFAEFPAAVLFSGG
jgi:(1->4)-alpha-D-glucan 1-alpha-D-glucosylmutase